MQSKKYKNQRGSILELTLRPNQEVKGFFTTAVASKDCQKIIGMKQPIIGYCTGNALTFSVVYKDCGSIYSVTGNFDKTREHIDVMGIINHQSEEATGKDCNSRFLTHDTWKACD